MLLSISLENWKSFENEVTFTMEASKEQQHKDTLAVFKKYRLRLLPVSAIFGSNASGKSNFVKAFSFIQRLLLEPEKGVSSPEPYSFRLDEKLKSEPSKIEIQLLLDNYRYTYFLAFTNQKIYEESLSVSNTSSDNCLFERIENNLTPGPLLKNVITKESLRFVQPLLNKNHPALSILGNANVAHVSTVLNWFINSLRIITPDSFSIHEASGDEEEAFADFKNLDTGIEKVEYQDYKDEFPESITKLCGDLENGEFFNYRDPKMGAFQISRDAKGIHAKKLLTVHTNKQGKKELFSFADESDGSLRLFDLMLPMKQLRKAKSSFTFVIDEFDRSLHNKMTSHLISRYLATCTSDTRNQLIFTTHDALLIDQDIFRRDELWITNREPDGSSMLYPMTDFKELRADKDIRKSYLDGRMGGLPNLLASQELTNNFQQEPVEVAGRAVLPHSVTPNRYDERYIRCFSASNCFSSLLSKINLSD